MAKTVIVFIKNHSCLGKLLEGSKKLISYDDAVSLSLTLVDFERSIHSPRHSDFHLERMRLFANLLGNPQNEVPSVHIAGTKGKGSTAAMVTSILLASGFTVGLATSPHLHSLTERIRVDMRPITKYDFVDLVLTLWPDVLKIESDYHLGPITWFEFMTMAAFYFFHFRRLDFQVIETGLGGRLDATNIIDPLVSSITSISLDHTSILGNDVRMIAREKAGIIKERKPVVVSPQSPEVLDVIQAIADERSSHLVDTSKMNVSSAQNRRNGLQQTKVKGRLEEYEFLLPLIGQHQVYNSLNAIGISEMLMEQGYSVSKTSIEMGLSNVSWPGRMEILKSDGPIVVVDGAHNQHSVMVAAQAILDNFEYSKLTLVFGATTGHDMLSMLRELLRLQPTIIPVKTRHPKSVSCVDIYSDGEIVGLNLISGNYTVSEGLETAIANAESSDIIVAMGSLSVVAESIEYMKNMEPEIYSEF